MVNVVGVLNGFVMAFMTTFMPLKRLVNSHRLFNRCRLVIRFPLDPPGKLKLNTNTVLDLNGGFTGLIWVLQFGIVQER